MVLLPLRAGFCRTAFHVHDLAVVAFVAGASETRADNNYCRVCRVWIVIYMDLLRYGIIRIFSTLYMRCFEKEFL